MEINGFKEWRFFFDDFFLFQIFQYLTLEQLPHRIRVRVETCLEGEKDFISDLLLVQSVIHIALDFELVQFPALCDGAQLFLSLLIQISVTEPGLLNFKCSAVSECRCEFNETGNVYVLSVASNICESEDAK
jgi:hypothetical protein